MDATTINTIVGIVGTLATIIGSVIGVIGWRSLEAATNINNRAKAGRGSTINQGNTYNYGISEDTVRLISESITKEELCHLMIRLIPINSDDENSAGNRLRNGTIAAKDFHEIIAKIPTIYYGKTPPHGFPKLGEGCIWLNTE